MWNSTVNNFFYTIQCNIICNSVLAWAFAKPALSSAWSTRSTYVSITATLRGVESSYINLIPGVDSAMLPGGLVPPTELLPLRGGGVPIPMGEVLTKCIQAHRLHLYWKTRPMAWGPRAQASTQQFYRPTAWVSWPRPDAGVQLLCRCTQRPCAFGALLCQHPLASCTQWLSPTCWPTARATPHTSKPEFES